MARTEDDAVYVRAFLDRKRSKIVVTRIRQQIVVILKYFSMNMIVVVGTRDLLFDGGKIPEAVQR